MDSRTWTSPAFDPKPRDLVKLPQRAMSGAPDYQAIQYSRHPAGVLGLGTASGFRVTSWPQGLKPSPWFLVDSQDAQLANCEE